MKELRDYQAEIVKKVIESNKNQVICLPTGAGKTVVAAEIIRQLPNAVLFVVPRLELLNQAKEEFEEVMGEGEVDIVWSNKTRLTGKKCIVCSKDSLRAQWNKIRFADPVIFFDEAHVSLVQSHALVQRIQPARVLGLTATPERMDGKALLRGSDSVHKYGIFDELVQQESVASLIKKGYLCPLKYYARPIEGITEIKPDSDIGYELSDEQMISIFDNNAIWGDLVASYEQYGKGKPTLGFTNTIMMGEQVVDIFNKAGYNFKIIHGQMSVNERKQLIDDLATGRVDGLVNAALLTYGFDCPPVSYAFSCRHIKSRPFWFQMVGRILRTCDGKTEAVFVDHGDSISEFSEPDCSLPILDEFIKWRVDGENKEEKMARKKKMKKVQDTMKIIQELDPIPLQMVEITMEDSWERLIRIINRQRKENDSLTRQNQDLNSRLDNKNNELIQKQRDIASLEAKNRELKKGLDQQKVVNSEKTFEQVKRYYYFLYKKLHSHEAVVKNLLNMEKNLDFLYDPKTFENGVNYWKKRINDEEKGQLKSEFYERFGKKR